MRALLELIGRVFAIAPASRSRIVGLVLVSLLVTATYLAQGVLIAQILVQVFTGSDVGSALWPAAGVVVLQVLRAGLLTVREAAALRVSGAVKDAVRDRLVRKLFELGPGALQRSRSGGVQATAVDAVELLDPLVGRFLPQVFASMIGTALAGAVVITIDPLVGSLIVVCAAAAPVTYLLGSRLMKRSGEAWTTALRGLYAENLDAVQGMATLKAFNASRRRGAQLHERAEEFCRYSIKLMIAYSASASVAAFAIPIGTAAAVGLAALQYAGGAITLAELFVLLLLARECFRPLTDLEAAYHGSYSSLPASREIFDLLARRPDVVDPDDPVPATTVTRPPVLEFREVSFGYTGRTERALDGFSMRVAAGERVAIVGRSGAGKTTVTSLLLRYFERDAGEIRLDGVDISRLTLTDLRELVGVVAQDTYLFHGTVRDNLVLGREGVAVSQIEAAARAACAHEFICALPRGYDTVIGERGLKLSGGERQRISIARALLKDPPVLVLDEPTSSVDAANEAEIQRALEGLTRGRTTLVIAHRLSTVRHADRIVVLDNGRVLESGRHESLMDSHGAYAELVAAQEGDVR
ncbi:MAG: ABC transporter ATP-binding protein [Pseudonocardia sp.]